MANRIIEGAGTLTDWVVRQSMKMERKREIPEGAVPIFTSPDGSVYLATIDRSSCLSPGQEQDYGDYVEGLTHS